MNIEEKRLYWFWLSKIEEVGSKTIDKLLHDFQSVEGIFRSRSEELRKLEYLTEGMQLKLMQDRSLEQLQMEFLSLAKRKIAFVIREEEKFPKRLLEIYEAPYYLYYRGELPAEETPSIAIIGARDCSTYGSEIARSYAKEMAQQGVIIISGLARGVDGQAHWGAIEAGGKTYGVIGNGLDICYPKENFKLFNRLIEEGGIISEYPLKSQALPFHFPMRNRLIAGLADGIFVVEAREKSGTLITVDRGLEQGKDIYALPGRVKDSLSKGCNNLIQNGAKLVQEPLDIIEELRCLYGTYFDHKKVGRGRDSIGGKTDKTQSSSELGEKILEQLSLMPRHVEMIAIDSQLPIAKVLEELTMLELAGKVYQVMAQCYVKRA